MRFFGVSEENGFGESVDTIDMYVDAPSVSFNLSGSTDIKVPTAMGRTEKQAKKGKRNSSGSFDVPVDVDFFEFIIALALNGTNEDVDGNKTFFATDKKELKSFRAMVGKEEYQEIYRGHVASEISLNVSEELVNMSVSTVGGDVKRFEGSDMKTEEEIYSNYVESLPFAFHEMTLKVDGKEIDNKDLKMSLNNNANIDNAHRNGSKLPRKIKGNKLEVGLDMKIFNDDALELLNKFDSEEIVYFPVEMTFELDGDKITITLPKCTVDGDTNDYSNFDEMFPAIKIATYSTDVSVNGEDVFTNIYTEVEKASNVSEI
ncbi:hypothetical protein GLW05_20835 [Pontibacillus yanchengensis]|uniref:Phage tail protein n=1 Tax=Pontibacillus yanchengensis TaxID=462910 RepID=A0A6I5A6K0_9BACI|nr:phage tail tube protein [Pontibacillus yanchengensis]MYL36020.1 hypothetical protein [Pontibacillus yanchengensis]